MSSRQTDAEYVAAQRESILAASDITPDRRRALLAWCDAGCPECPFDDSWGDYETGDFC